MSRPPLIAVVDDDVSVRESLPGLLSTLGFCATAFDSAAAFLDSEMLAATDCLVLDIEMPGMTGPELLHKLARRRLRIPVVFITAHASEEMRLTLLRQGAVACLTKPFTEAALVDALRRALPGGSPGTGDREGGA
jgi:FixJ family two-component response regulator